MRAWLVACVLSVAGVQASSAGVESWSITREQDPFTKGERVTIDYMESFRSGALIMCDTAKSGFTFRAIPGFTADESMANLVPAVDIAVDGVVMPLGAGRVMVVSDNLAVSEVDVAPEVAARFTDMLQGAREQVAVRDGISDRPALLSAKGAKASGMALYGCLARQPGK